MERNSWSSKNLQGKSSSRHGASGAREVGFSEAANNEAAYDAVVRHDDSIGENEEIHRDEELRIL